MTLHDALLSELSKGDRTIAQLLEVIPLGQPVIVAALFELMRSGVVLYRLPDGELHYCLTQQKTALPCHRKSG